MFGQTLWGGRWLGRDDATDEGGALSSEAREPPERSPRPKEPCQRRRTAMCNRSAATILYIAAKPFRAEALRSDEGVSALARVLAEGAEGDLWGVFIKL
jgi:hypothetical protein